MFDRLKQYLFHYRLRHLPARQAKWIEWEQVRNILVLYESDYTEQNTVIKHLRDSILAEDKDATLWGYVDKKEITSLILPQSRILGAKNITWSGMPDKSIIEDLNNRYYDLLIDLSQHPLLPLQYLAMYARADCKVGMKLTDGIHDFMVDMPAEDTPEHLYQQLRHFLSTIRSKK